MNRKIYLETLEELTQSFESIKNTIMGMYLKVTHLITLKIRYEEILSNQNLDDHPYLLIRDIIKEQLQSFQNAIILLAVEEKEKSIKLDDKPAKIEAKHQVLFNQLWQFGPGSRMERFINRFKQRIKINNLSEFIRRKRCLDLGCGNGTFCFALADVGANFVSGIDYAEDAIKHAEEIRKKRKNGDIIEFCVGSVYNLPYDDSEFDFLVQNGVFHHLEHLTDAIKEAKRVLKPKGYFWYFTFGKGGVGSDIMDRIIFLLRKVPSNFMIQIFRLMNMSKDLITNYVDHLNATYNRTTWKEITQMLADAGFGNFKRLRGGFPTNLDQDKIKADPYGKEKFGEGNFRILAQLLEN